MGLLKRPRPSLDSGVSVSAAQAGAAGGGRTERRSGEGGSSGAARKQPLQPSSQNSDAPVCVSTNVTAAFKCPVPNYQPKPGKRLGTLGQGRSWQEGLTSLSRVITAAALSAAAPASGEPLLIFDPKTPDLLPQDMPDKENLHKVEVDAFIAGRLRPHQAEGVKFMLECLMGLRDPQHTGCILADGMGLGKTFQSCAVIYTLLTVGIRGKPTCSAPLILCPSSLVSNWGSELRKWLGDRVEPVLLDDTRAAKVKEGLQGFVGGKAQYGARRRACQVLVMSYNTYRLHKQLVAQKGIDMLIADESHVLKNGSSQITAAVMSIPAKVRLLLTGTPIQNDLAEFFTLLDVAVPGLLGAAAAFRRRFETPILRSQDADASDAEVQLGQERSGQLQQLCSRFMIRRTSDINQQYLPKMVETVVFCKMSKLQHSLYTFFLASGPVQRALTGRAATRAAAEQEHDQAQPSARPRLTDAGSASCQSTAHAGDNAAPLSRAGSSGPEGLLDPAATLSALPAITALKKLCCHPDLIYALVRGPEESARPTAGRRSTGGWVNPGGGPGAAAEARATTGFEGCLPVFNSAYPAYQAMSCQMLHSGKLLVLVSLLKAVRQAYPTDKVVLVSNYTEALGILGRMCLAQNWGYLQLDGSMDAKQRQPTVDNFNNPADPSFVLLLSSKAGGTGLNIIGANRLVLMDPDWNPANDAQAMARVWREGQKKDVWIYRLLATGSIEEKMYQRQLSKMGLSKTIVDEANQSRQFRAEELRSLFSRVDLSTLCDTHAAIKCACDGSKEAMAQKQAAGVQRQQRQSEGEGGEAELGSGVMGWAHLRDTLHSPDAVWAHVPAHIRDTYVTFLFSDHVIKPRDKVQDEDEDGEEGEEEDGEQEQEQDVREEEGAEVEEVQSDS